MQLDFSSEKPIYQQIAEWIEDAILSGAYNEEEQIPSTTEISVSLQINPATALKGMNRLVDDKIIYKKRGLGMFVTTGSVDVILEKRKLAFIEGFVKTLVDEAKKLGISKEEVMKQIEKGFEK